MYWQGKQIYFKDPNCNLVEILENGNPYGVEIDGWYGVCELGMPPEDVQGLNEFLGVIPNHNESESDTFRF